MLLYCGKVFYTEENFKVGSKRYMSVRSQLLPGALEPTLKKISYFNIAICNLMLLLLGMRINN